MKTILLFLTISISLFAGKKETNFFIENKGQWPSEVKYLANVGGMNAWITESGVVYDYYQITRNYNEKDLLRLTPDKKTEFQNKNTSIKGHVVKMQLVDAIIPSAVGNNKQQGYYNYFIGKDKTKWTSFVPLYSDIELNGIYKNINVKYYFDGNSIRYDYIIKPGADLSQLKLKFEGQESIRINDAGELVIMTSLGEVTNGKLYSYQVDNEKQNEVNCKFVQQPDGSISFNIMNYDKNKELIIDPLIYSTFIGGTYSDRGNSIALGADGNVYIAGSTGSSNYPIIVGAYQNSFIGYNDAFITKMDSTGSSLVYSTFIGALGDGFVSSVVIDTNGNAYVVGATDSTTFPTTTGAYQNSISSYGYNDVFVTKLNPAGSALIYSTFIGGGLEDIGISIAIDAGGNAYITGLTFSSNYPVTPGAVQTSLGGSQDAFVTKLNPAGTALVYSTFLGGVNDDCGYSIAVDSAGNSYIAGSTMSSDYLVTVGAYQSIYGGANGSFGDAFITKLNPAGTALVYSTFLGGSNDDHALSIAVDNTGNAYITGGSSSGNYPVTTGAYQTTYGGGSGYYGDAFVTKLNPSGSGLGFSTFIGGNSEDCGTSLAIDPGGNIFITGWTQSSNYPVTNEAWQTASGGGYDVIVTKLNPAGNALVYSTYLGGSFDDIGNSMIVDGNGNTYITGSTASANFPTTVGAYQTTHQNFNGHYLDVFVTKLSTPAGNLPVQLTNFTAKQDNGIVTLKWETATELNNYIFEIERKSNNKNYEIIGSVPGSGNSTNTKNYYFIDSKPFYGKSSYRLKQIDVSGKSTYSNQLEITLLPAVYSLAQNYPNPWNPSTLIKYTIPYDSKIRLMIFNSLGQEVALLKDEISTAGSYQIEFNSKQLSSGIYFYRLHAESIDGNKKFSSIKKMILLK